MKEHEISNKKSRLYQCQMCGCTFAWHLAFKTWIPNTSILTFALIKQEISAMSVSDVWMYICLTFGFKDLNSQHIYYDFCFDQTRYLSHIGVRCVDVHLLDIWLSRLEFPTHRFWLLLWSNKKSRPCQCQMCGCTFAWHLALKTWIPNTSIMTFASIK